MRNTLNVLRLLTIALVILGGEQILFPLWNSAYAVSESRIVNKSEQNDASQFMDEGDQYYRTGYLRQALAFYEQALSVYKASGDLVGEGKALNRIGNTLNRLNESEKALEFIQRAFIIYQDLNDQRSLGETLTNLGAAYVRSQQLDQAQEVLEQALAIHQELGNQEGEANTFRELANVINSRSNSTSESIQQALAYAQQSMELAQEIRNPEIEARALLVKRTSINKIANSIDDHQEAINYAQQALVISRNSQNRSLEGTSLRIIAWSTFNLALLSDIPDDYQQAINYAQQALAIFQEVDVRSSQEESLRLISRAIYSSAEYQEEYQEAIDYAQRALTIAKEIEKRSSEENLLRIIAWSMRNIALLTNSPDKHQEAINYAHQAVAIARELGYLTFEGSSLRLIAWSMRDIALLTNSLNKHQEAIDYAQKALVNAKELNSQIDEDRMLRLIAVSHYTMASLTSSVEQYSQAIDYAQQSLDVSLALGSRRNEEESLRFIARSYYETFPLTSTVEKCSQAIEYAKQAFIIAQELKGQTHELENLGVIADCNYKLALLSNSPEQYQEAIHYAQKAILIAQEIEKGIEEASFLQLIAKIKYNLATTKEEYQNLISYVQQALVVAKRAQNKTSEGELLRLLAFANSQITTDFQEAYKASLTYLEESLAVAKESENTYLEAITLADIANANYQASNYKESLEFARQSFELASETGDAAALMYASIPLLQIYDLLGNDQEAFDIIERALDDSQKLGIEILDSIFFSLLGYLSWKLEDSQRAVDFIEQATEISSRTNYPELKLLSSLFSGVIYGGIKQEEKALDLFQDILTSNDVTLNDFSRSMVLTLSASLHSELGNTEEAINLYRQVLSLTEKNESAHPYSVYAGLARIYEEQNLPNTAITYYKLAVNNVEDFRLKLSGLPSDAQDTFLASIIDFDRSTPADIYRELADLLLSQGRILEAQQVLEILKGQELSDFKTGRTRAVWNGENLVYNEVEQTVIDTHGSLIALGQKINICRQEDCAELDSLYDDRTQLERIYNQEVSEFEESIRSNRSDDLKFSSPDSLSTKASDIVEAEPNTVLIYPLVLEDKLWLLWTTAGKVSGTIEVPVTRQKLGEVAINFRQLLQNPSEDNLPALQSAAQELYGWLIEPLSESLEDNNIENLVFAHDRATRYIPMAALHDGEQYLIQRYRISSVLSAELTDTEERFTDLNNPSILGLGLSEAVGGFSELPSVPVELDAIVQSDDGDVQGVYPGTTYLDQEFDESVLWTNAYKNRILHIATHAKFEPGLPGDSYLVLGNGDPLTIEEIKINLSRLEDVHMVVLSACETALGGPAADGTEIAGISSYFLETGGAKTVLASLWQVNDDSTSLLMQQFYENLANDDLTKAEALRQAQLSLLQTNEQADGTARAFINIVDTRTGETIQPTGNLAHPYYWAPFILIGNSL